jgi:hypothetical protein
MGAIPKGIIWVASGFVAIMLAAIAIWPTLAPTIQRDGAALIAAGFGVLALVRPETVQGWWQPRRPPAFRISLIWYRIMGIIALYIAAALAFPAIASWPQAFKL